MRSHVVRRAILFAAGVAALEGGSSVVHALVLKDIPPELAAQGVDLWWMLSRDLLLSVLGAVAFVIGTLPHFARRARSGGYAACFALGFGFAVALELLNWIIPNALLAPASVLQGVVAWTYFIGGSVLAAHLVARRTIVETRTPL